MSGDHKPVFIRILNMLAVECPICLTCPRCESAVNTSRYGTEECQAIYGSRIGNLGASQLLITKTVSHKLPKKDFFGLKMNYLVNATKRKNAIAKTASAAPNLDVFMNCFVFYLPCFLQLFSLP
jgi:hypothetical protein